MRSGWAATLLLAVAALGGCDRSADGTSANANPATNPSHARSGNATSTPATSPATTQAAESLISIDGNLMLFPAAKMRIDEADGKVVARLFSDDPQGALEENYEGNSFYLQIELDEEDAKDLNGAVLTFGSSSSEAEDSPYGIFVDGRRWVLQPADVRLTFMGSGSPLEVQLNGTFLMFDSNNENAKPRRAVVAAKLLAAVQARK